MESELNIYQRLNEVRKSVEYIQKDLNVQGYKAVSHDLVTSVVRPKLVEHGIFIIPSKLHSNVVDTGRTSGHKNNPVIRYESSYSISFVNMDKPCDRFMVEIESHADDSGDKAPGKAISMAVKIAILKVLNLETGENEESREESRPRQLTDEEAQNLARMLEETQSDTGKFFDHFGVTSFSDLTSNHYKEAVKMLGAKKRKAA